MSFRYADIGRKFTPEELEKRNQIDYEILGFIRKLNPTTESVFYNKHIINKVMETLSDIYTKDLKLCTERAFYP
ncbi:MAG: hypothetical protein LBC76_09000 [Treponema sp.]|jgi:hypothetical protein|nr:hypothetical protein [Treponema sp.]